MSTIFVYDHARLDGEGFAAALIDQHTAPTDAECLDWFSEHYDGNDYCASFRHPIA